MSHQPERKQKNCLNCGTIVNGRYCHICGQENILPKQNFWTLTKHFVFDVFHFDGKFFDTLKPLFSAPGRLSKDYILGKRARYLDPIRMYLFTSAIFFLIFYNIGPRDTFNAEDQYVSKAERLELASRLLKDSVDPSTLSKLSFLLDTSVNLKLVNTVPNTKDTGVIRIEGRTYVLKSGDFIQTDSALKSNWLIQKIAIKLNNKIKENDNNIRRVSEDFGREFIHKLPYLLFISLPLFALVLKLLYASKKGFYYSDHAVFTLHHYILSFLLLLLAIIFLFLKERAGWAVFDWLVFLVFVVWPLYLYLAMKRFYQQGWLKTFFKFILLNLFGISTLIFLFVAYILFILII